VAECGSSFNKTETQIILSSFKEQPIINANPR
jgi:hypothetical protein